MQKIKYFNCLNIASYFVCSKRCQIKYSTLFHHEINNKRELQNIAINHSADFDCQDFKKIYRECTKEPFNFLTIDTMLPASDPLRFRKNLFDSYKNDNEWSDSNFKQKTYAKWRTIWFIQKAAKISALSLSQGANNLMD